MFPLANAFIQTLREVDRVVDQFWNSQFMKANKWEVIEEYQALFLNLETSASNIIKELDDVFLNTDLTTFRKNVQLLEYYINQSIQSARRDYDLPNRSIDDPDHLVECRKQEREVDDWLQTNGYSIWKHFLEDLELREIKPPHFYLSAWV